MTTKRAAQPNSKKRKALFDLDLLRLFVRVVEVGTIAGAAREFAISSSFANRRIASLTDRVGAQLFLRAGRRLELTVAGERLLRWARESLAGHDALLDDFDAIANKPSGTVRFACYAPALDSYLMSALELFNEKYPEITVEVATSDRPLRLISEGFDIAIHAGPMPEEGNFVTKLVQKFDRLVCASPEYIARNGIPRKPHDLVQHKCLVHSQNEAAIWYFVGDRRQREAVSVRASMRSNSYLLLKDLAVRGLGIVRIGENLVKRALEDGSLVQVLSDYRCVSRAGDDFSVRLIYPSHKLPHRVRVFERHLFSLMKKHWRAVRAGSR